MRTVVVIFAVISAMSVGYRSANCGRLSVATGAPPTESNMMQRNPRPLDLSQIDDLIPIMPDSALAGEIRNRGIVFPVNDQLIRELKQKGAGPQTLAVLNGFVGNQPPTVTLQLAKTIVHFGEVIEINADGIDPDGDQLDYYWSTNFGTIRAEGRKGKLELTGTSTSSPMEVKVSVTVSDRKGGSAFAEGVLTRTEEAARPRRADDHEPRQETAPNVPTAVSVSEPPSHITPTMTIDVSAAGEYWLITLSGSSKDEAGASGTLFVNVSPAAGGHASPSVRGMLSGKPCRVWLVPSDNVAAQTILEAPSSKNGWSKLVVGVLPKDRAPAFRFSIEWQLANGPLVPPEPVAPSEVVANTKVSKAVMIKQVAPEYPREAIVGRVEGSVQVSISLDELGNVTSVKAVNGPKVLFVAAENAARGCKFRPALIDGKPTASVVLVGFEFKLLK